MFIAILGALFLVNHGGHLGRRRPWVRLGSSDRYLLIPLGVWPLLHNAMYAAWMPQVGAAGRYAPMNHLAFWTAIPLSVVWMRGAWSRIAATVVIILMLGTSQAYWYRVYRANIDYMISVRIAAAGFVDGTCDPTRPVATVDLGPLRCFARQPILDLLGSVNRDMPQFLADRQGLADYLMEKDVECLYVWAPVDSIGIDALPLMGQVDSPHFQIRMLARYSVSIQERSLGSSPLGS